MNSEWIIKERGRWVDMYVLSNDAIKHKRVSRFMEGLDELNLSKSFFDALSSVELSEISIDIASQSDRVFSFLRDDEKRLVLLSMLRRAPGFEASILAYLVGNYFNKLESNQILNELLSRPDICRENICDAIQGLV